jgi:hypothetical protein
MPLPYEIKANITRQDARQLIVRLADEPAFRDEFERNTREVLAEHGIEVGPETLPEEVTLPDPDAIREFLDLVEAKIAPEAEAASPFAFALLILVFAAMPVLIGDSQSLDGKG